MSPFLATPSERPERDGGPWWERGACRGNTDAEFFPTLDSDIAAIDRAYALCRACPLDVRARCETAAEGWGIWNGINRQPQIERSLRGRHSRIPTPVQQGIASASVTSIPEPTSRGAGVAVALLAMGEGAVLTMEANIRDARSAQQSGTRYLARIGNQTLRLTRREKGTNVHEFSLAVKP